MKRKNKRTVRNTMIKVLYFGRDRGKFRNIRKRRITQKKQTIDDNNDDQISKIFVEEKMKQNRKCILNIWKGGW